jgi:hypothetical protein
MAFKARADFSLTNRKYACPIASSLHVDIRTYKRVPFRLQAGFEILNTGDYEE